LHGNLKKGDLEESGSKIVSKAKSKTVLGSVVDVKLDLDDSTFEVFKM